MHAKQFSELVFRISDEGRWGLLGLGMGAMARTVVGLGLERMAVAVMGPLGTGLAQQFCNCEQHLTREMQELGDLLERLSLEREAKAPRCLGLKGHRKQQQQRRGQTMWNLPTGAGETYFRSGPQSSKMCCAAFASKANVSSCAVTADSIKLAQGCYAG